jgi:hypothetical protein
MNSSVAIHVVLAGFNDLPDECRMCIDKRASVPRNSTSELPEPGRLQVTNRSRDPMKLTVVDRQEQLSKPRLTSASLRAPT